MTDKKVEKLVHHISSLLDLDKVDIPSLYESMGEIIIDGMLHGGLGYHEHAGPKAQAFAAAYPKIKTVSDFVKLAETKGDNEKGFAEISGCGDWKGFTRHQRMQKLADFFLLEQVDTVEDFKRWMGKEENVARLVREVEGIGETTAKYFKILAGNSEVVAVETHLRKFVKDAGIQVSDDDEAERILLDAAKILKVPPCVLDAAIWQYQSSKRRKKDGA